MMKMKKGPGVTDEQHIYLNEISPFPTHPICVMVYHQNQHHGLMSHATRRSSVLHNGIEKKTLLVQV